MYGIVFLSWIGSDNLNENLDMHCSIWSSSVRDLPRLEDGIDRRTELPALACLLRLSWASPPLSYSLGLKLITGPWPVSFDLEEEKVKKVIKVLEPASPSA